MSRSVLASTGVVRTEPAPLGPRPAEGNPRHAFTVDVEDWYQSCIDFDAPITERVVRNVDRILQVLAESGAKGTFFVQGMVAEAFPTLVASLAADGHEVQSHGYSHRPLFAMNRAALRQELERGKKAVEDAAGRAVTAFRAQDFSIGEGNLWALETVADVGFEVDSSIFPMRTRRYGVPGWHLEPHRLSVEGGATLLEVPVAIWSRRPFRIPVCGGGYFRMFPRWVIEAGLRSIDAEDRPAIVYCHPYEFAPEELAEYRTVAKRVRVQQGIGRGASPQRFRRLLSSLPFGRLSDVLESWGLR